MKPFRIWKVAALFGVVSVAAIPSPAAAASWQVSANTSSGSTTVTINSSFTAPSNQSNVQLDTEVFDPTGKKVAQWFKTTAVSAGQTQRLSYTWSTTGKSSGTYTVKLGIFDSSWSKLHAWSDKAATFSVGSAKPAASPSYSSGSSRRLDGNTFWGVNQHALNQANEWRSSRSGDANIMNRLAYTPTAQWFGSWSRDVRSDVSRATADAKTRNATAVLVAYNIVGRDCNGYSSGGSGDEGSYNNWISEFAAGVNSKAVVVLEPDALAQLCGDSSARYRMLGNAIDKLNAKGAHVYIDAGHSNWIEPSVMAERLKKAGVSRAAGFAVNVANFYTTAESQAYGEKISSQLGGAGYVVDTSRNGSGSSGQWCNPTNATVGQSPTANTNAAHADAYIWVKSVGDSDGYCNGGPGAGQWSSDIAMKLTRNWR